MATQESMTGDQGGTVPNGTLTLGWWAEVARGMLALTFGVGVLIELVTRGDLQLRSYLLFFGVYVLIDGVLTFFIAWHHDNDVSPLGMFAFESLVGLSAGLISIVLALFGGVPITLSLFSTVVVLWALLTGMSEVASATMTERITLAVVGLLSISLGVLVFGFYRLGFGEQSLLIVLAGYLFVVGVVYPPLPVNVGEFTPFTNLFSLRNHLEVLINVYWRELNQYEAELRTNHDDDSAAGEGGDGEGGDEDDVFGNDDASDDTDDGGDEEDDQADGENDDDMDSEDGDEDTDDGAAANIDTDDTDDVTEDAQNTPPLGEETIEESSVTTLTDPLSESETCDPWAGLSASSQSDSVDHSIDIARYFLCRADEKRREGDLASCVTYFYRANEEKITIRAEQKPEVLHQMAKRIVSISRHYFDEKRVTAIENSLFTEGRLTATPNDLRNEWRNVYNASIRRLKSVLVVRFLLRVFSAVLLVGLIALGALSFLGLSTPVVENVAPESPAGAPFSPFVVAVMLLGVLGSVVNNARTWTAQEPTLKIRQFEQESAQLSLSRSIAGTRLLVGATAAVFIYYLVITDLITIAGESAALYLAIAFVAGFSDELVSKGVDKLLGEIAEKSSEPAAAETGSGPSAPQTATENNSSPMLTIGVKNSNDDPVSGANVTISGRVDTEIHEKATEQSGKVEFCKLTLDTYTVIVTKGTERRRGVVTFKNQNKEVEITINSEAGE